MTEIRCFAAIPKIIKTHPAKNIEGAEENQCNVRGSYGELEYAVEVANQIAQLDGVGIWVNRPLPLSYQG
jgi:hypothetical protein